MFFPFILSNLSGATRLLFEVRLNNGEVVSPLNLKEIRKLIYNDKIVGTELAREYPNGKWQDINMFQEIADFLLSKAQDQLSEASRSHKSLGYKTLKLSGFSHTGIISGSAKTVVLQKSKQTELRAVTTFGGAKTTLLEQSKRDIGKKDGSKEPLGPIDPHEEATEKKIDSSGTEIAKPSEKKIRNGTERKKFDLVPLESGSNLRKPDIAANDRNLDQFGIPFSQRETVVIERPKNQNILIGQDSKNEKTKKTSPLRSLRIPLLFVLMAILYLESDPQKPTPESALLPSTQPTMPRVDVPQRESQLSTKLYQEAIPFYLEDTVLGYREALKRFSLAASFDSENLKAYAMLASCYINLVDHFQRDEKYFAVVSKLIELIQSKNIELPEKVIALAEYYVMLNQTDIAENKIVEYTKSHPGYGLEMFYYLAFVLQQRGQIQLAANYLAQISDGKAFSPKIFYLKGLLAESANERETSLNEFSKAVKKSKNHVKSMIKIVEAQVFAKPNQLTKAFTGFKVLLRDLRHFTPKELAYTYYLLCKYKQMVFEKQEALGYIEKALKLDRDNQTYFEEYYNLFAELGGPVEFVRKAARMFYYINEGDRVLKEGNTQNALVQFMQARQESPNHPVPLVKMGDLFKRMNDLGNAKRNYKQAIDRAPLDVDIWSKYLDVLIQSFEWKEAEQVVQKFRRLNVNQSALDKAAGDNYLMQGRVVDAQASYKMALSRRVVSPGAYVGFGKSLILSQNYKEAAFFFSMAIRQDPFNSEALVGIAKSIAGSESIDRAINYLQEELKTRNGIRGELLAAIAEFQIQKGSYDDAQIYLDEAKSANPDLAYPWRLQAIIYLNYEPPLDPTRVQKKGPSKYDKALEAFQRYSDRNASDPVGYLERFRIYTGQKKFDKAELELTKIYGIFPKYPNLHYYRGLLYSNMGNHRVSVEELKLELENNPNSFEAIMRLGKELDILGERRDALAQYNRAMELDPASSEAKYHAGHVNFLLKDYGRAIALLQTASGVDTGNPLIFKSLGEAYLETGKKKEAAAAFKKFLELDPEASDRASYERYLR